MGAGGRRGIANQCMVRKTEMVNEAKENTVVKWQEREKAETEKASRQEAKVEKGKGANWGLGSAGKTEREGASEAKTNKAAS